MLAEEAGTDKSLEKLYRQLNKAFEHSEYESKQTSKESGDLSDYDDNISGKGSVMTEPNKSGSRKKKLIIKCLKEKN